MNDSIHLSSCPICCSKLILSFSAPCDYRRYADEGSFDVHWCSECSYGLVLPRPTQEQVAAYYQIDDYYTHNVSGPQPLPAKLSLLDRFRRHLSWRFDNGKELSPEEAINFLSGSSYSLLEIGCGNGVNMGVFKEGGFSVVGVEPDARAREVCARNGLEVFDGSAERLPEEILEHRYDVILMSHVLEHCIDVDLAVANAKQLLSVGGVLIVEVPNCESLGFSEQVAAWPWSDIPRHLNFFSSRSLKCLLEKHEFDILGIKYRGYCRQFSNEWLDTERSIWQAFQACGKWPFPEPKYKLRAWKLLLRSIFSNDALKYDSVRVIAR